MEVRLLKSIPGVGAAAAGASRLMNLPTTRLPAGLYYRLNIGAAARHAINSDLEIPFLLGSVLQGSTHKAISGGRGHRALRALTWTV